MVIVRFAPSPTGFLHLGSARTALFNWLYARHCNGKFLLRVEDTDQTRSKQEFLDEILSDLKWMGLDWDNELIYQSKRFDIYREKAQDILKAGKAYKEGEAIIFKVENGREIDVNDVIHGKITFNTDEIKDQVMIKSDGSPAYNFCCVVDDIELGITHIIRGDDHLSNTPKQMLFYEALDKIPPVFCHIPLMMGSDGAKLSKRHGAVSAEEYKNDGFLPEALANYLILLGWSPGDNREVINLEEVVKIFDIKDMKDVQARFDMQKLRWINGEYIASKSASELLPLIEIAMSKTTPHVIPSGLSEPTKQVQSRDLKKLINLYKPRVKTINEFVSFFQCFFADDYEVDEKGKEKYLSSPEDKNNLKGFAEKLEKLTSFTHDKIEDICRVYAEEKGIKPAKVIHPARMAISGKTVGAGLFEMMEIMGKARVIERIKKVIIKP